MALPRIAPPSSPRRNFSFVVWFFLIVLPCLMFALNFMGTVTWISTAGGVLIGMALIHNVLWMVECRLKWRAEQRGKSKS